MHVVLMPARPPCKPPKTYRMVDEGRRVVMRTCTPHAGGSLDARTLGREDANVGTPSDSANLDRPYLGLCPLRSMSSYHHSGTPLIDFSRRGLLKLELVMVSTVVK